MISLGNQFQAEGEKPFIATIQQSPVSWIEIIPSLCLPYSV